MNREDWRNAWAQYRRNWASYWYTWGRLARDKIPGGYKPGWGPTSFALLVLLPNIGTNVALGGAVSTWSRSFYEYRRRGSRVAKFLDRLLGKLEEDHGEKSAPAYWGTTACPGPFRLALAGGALLLGAGAWLIA
jgi:hypothetical protein